MTPKQLLARIGNRLLKPFGLKVVPAHHNQLVYLHDYGEGGYEKYKAVQIHHNKRKLENVWADKDTLQLIANYILKTIGKPKAGICHGTRRGYEQQEFSRLLGCEVIGTEISDTASQFPNTVQWDFHDQKEEWIGKFSFAYSNSLDQALNPEKALKTWTEQLTPDGLLFIEHTMAHSAEGASEMDPFGAHPYVMPYLIFQWGKGRYKLVDILRPEHRKGKGLEIWLFVIARI